MCRPSAALRTYASRLAVVLVLAVGLSPIAACSRAAPPARTEVAAPATGRSAPAARSSSTGRAPVAGLNAEVLDDLFPASGVQYSVGARFEGTEQALQGVASASCMARSGFHVQQRSASQWAAGFFDNSQFPDLDKISRADSFGPYLDSLAQAQVPAGQQDAYRSAVSRCGPAAAQPFGPLRSASDGLKVQWLHIVASVQASAAVRTQVGGFRSCAEQAGAPADVVRPAASDQAFSSFLAWVTGLESRSGTEAGWAAVNRHWAPVFVRCARATVAVQTSLLLADQKAFLAAHQRQVQVLEAMAGQVVTRLESRYGQAVADG